MKNQYDEDEDEMLQKLQTQNKEKIFIDFENNLIQFHNKDLTINQDLLFKKDDEKSILNPVHNNRSKNKNKFDLL